MDEFTNRMLEVGNLAVEVDEEILYELFIQAGPVDNVVIPNRNSFPMNAYVVYRQASSIDYALELYRGTKLFHRRLDLKKKENDIPALHSMGPGNNPKEYMHGNRNQFHMAQNYNQQMNLLPNHQRHRRDMPYERNRDSRHQHRSQNQRNQNYRPGRDRRYY